MKLAKSLLEFFNYLGRRLIGLFNIIAPPSLPFLYRFTLTVFFSYIIIGIVNLSYKNITLIKISAMKEQTEQLKKEKDKLAHDMELLSDPALLNDYYRERFGLVAQDETGLMITN